MEEENKLIPFSLYYPLYGDDNVTPLTYRIGGHRVPDSLYNTILVDPNTGHVLLSEQDQRTLALAPRQEALSEYQTLGDRVLTTIKPAIDVINAARNAFPLTSDARVDAAKRHPEAMNAVQEGGNLAGNMILAPFTTAIGLEAVEGLIGAINTARALYAAGETLEAGKYIASIIGAIGGSIAGHAAGDEIVRNVTHGLFSGYADFMERAIGLWPYNSELTNPFSIGGGYTGSTFGSGFARNWRPWFENNLIATYELSPAEAPNPVGGSNTKAGVRYDRSVSGGFNRTSGLSRTAGRKGGPRQLGKTTGVTPDRIVDNRSILSNNGSASTTLSSRVFTPFGTPVPNTFMPYMPSKLSIPTPEPVQQTLLKEVTTGLDPFEEWWAQQRPGSRAYWPGSEDSAWPAGWKLIVGGGNSRAYSERGRMGVGVDQTGRETGTPASTYGRYTRRLGSPVKEATRVEVLPGELPNVELNLTEPKIIYP